MFFTRVFRTLHQCGFLLSLLLGMGTMSCSRLIGNTEDRIKEDGRDLTNNVSSFIYNMVPDSGNAGISGAYTTAINTFSVNLLKKVYADEEFLDNNLVLSPYCVSRNLSVLAEGVVGVSKEELLTALGGQAALDDAQEALRDLLYADNSIILQIADALWVDSTKFSIIPSYEHLINSKYGVGAFELDLSNKNAAVSTINNWVSDNTNGYIDEAIDDSYDLENAAAFLTSTIYFEADWASPFDITSTYKESFESPDGSLSVDMMRSGHLFEARSNDLYQNVKLYYGSEGYDYFYFDVYMPQTMSVEDFISQHVQDALSDTDSTIYTQLKMPKFFFTSSIALDPMLKELGVNRIFDPANQDVTGIVESRDTSSPYFFYVNTIRHKAGIKTDEEGTTAYAVTVTQIDGLTSAAPPDEIVFNKPFVYFIRAGQNGLILFAGVVNNPNKQ